MNIDNLNERWSSLKDDANKALLDAIKANGGAYYFVNENDDLSELCLPIVDAYTYYKGQQGSFYVTAIILGDSGLEFYGIDEQNSLDLTDTIQLDHIALSSVLDILEYLPEIETNEIQDATIEPHVSEISVVSLCRADLEDVGYSPDVTDNELQQIANRIGKYLEWQDFFSQFLDNVREACNYLNIPALEND